MTKDFFIKKLELQRATSITAKQPSVSDTQEEILESVKQFGIDEVYFCDDQPAVFIKHVTDFQEESIKDIFNTHHQAWNYKKVLQLYVISDLEIRIYNCAERPADISNKLIELENESQKIELFRCGRNEKEKLNTLVLLFSRIAIDTGIIWTLEEAHEIKKKINLQRRVDKYLVKSLISVAQELKSNGLDDIDLIHKLIMRSLFLLFLEDRSATDAAFYKNIKLDAVSYFDILPDVEATYKLFDELELHFKGNLFTVSDNEKEIVKPNHLSLIKKCFINGFEGGEQISIFENWRIFNFNIIQIELLSEIYENFLSEIDLREKQETGTFYTPPPLVELILNEKIPIDVDSEKFNITILDPSCGSGIFLVEAFKRLIKRYERSKKVKLTDYKILKSILLDNIFGIEIDSRSIKVAAFSLYLALLENLNPKTLWQKKALPNLINNPNDPTIKEQGSNLFCRDTIARNLDIESKDFDLVIGNPPFGTEKLSKTVRDYCDKHNFAKEMVLPFLHKASTFSKNGEVALIFNTKILTNGGSKYQNFRKWLFNECFVEKIYNFSILRKAPQNFGGQLFGSAVGPISIVFFKSKVPKLINNRIAYYAPKTYVKMDILEGIVIDKSDLKYLPREICKDPASKIWKVAMWGTLQDLELIERLEKKSSTVGKALESKSVKNGVGFQLLTQNTDKPRYSESLDNLEYLNADNITRYFTHSSNFSPLAYSIKTQKATKFYLSYHNVNNVREIKKIVAYRRLGDLKAYKAPHMVLKKGLEKNLICASYLDNDCAFRDGVYGFYCTLDNNSFLKALVSYFNSKLSAYFLFLTISSYGIEREQIMKNEYLSLPFNLTEDDQKILAAHMESFITDSFLRPQNLNHFNETIEDIIFKSFGLSEKDKMLINDVVDINIDLFHRQEKSTSLLYVLDYLSYGRLICEEINAFLEGSGSHISATIFQSATTNPLSLIKLSFSDKYKDLVISKEDLTQELKMLDHQLYTKKATNIYFRKKVNYYDDNDIYLIRPNQRRFWSRTMAIEDASDLILEILNMRV